MLVSPLVPTTISQTDTIKLLAGIYNIIYLFFILDYIKRTVCTPNFVFINRFKHFRNIQYFPPFPCIYCKTIKSAEGTSAVMLAQNTFNYIPRRG